MLFALSFVDKEGELRMLSGHGSLTDVLLTAAHEGFKGCKEFSVSVMENDEVVNEGHTQLWKESLELIR